MTTRGSRCSRNRCERSDAAAICSSLEALTAAHDLGVRVIALTGNGGGKMATQLRGDDVHICVPHQQTARIQEVHLLVLHCLCDAIDFQLFGTKQ